MKPDPIRGKTLRFSFDDGPMAGKTYEHRFAADGVTFRNVDEGQTGGGEREPRPVKYEVAQVNDRVWAVSYLSAQGYTLTTIIDVETRKLVGFASNEKSLVVQRGRVDGDLSR